MRRNSFWYEWITAVIFGLITISIGSMAIITRGMPAGKQRAVGLLSVASAGFLASACSNFALYSGVSGASWPRPGGFEGSNCAPPTRTHCPDQSG